MSYSPESRSTRRFEGISAVTGITNNPMFNNNITFCTSNPVAAVGVAPVSNFVGF